MMTADHRDQAGVDYRSLAEFRYQLRLFLRFSEAAAREAGLEPQHYQLLLAVKGVASGEDVTISYLTERLQLRHHSTVELVNRLEARGLVRRRRDSEDRRRVLVELTAKGERVLARLSRHHVEAINSSRGLVRALSRVTRALPPAKRARAGPGSGAPRRARTQRTT